MVTHLLTGHEVREVEEWGWVLRSVYTGGEVQQRTFAGVQFEISDCEMFWGLDIL